jgi:transposase
VNAVVERSFAWASRFRRLARDYERLPATVAGLHFAAFAILMLVRAAAQSLLLPQVTIPSA